MIRRLAQQLQIEPDELRRALAFGSVLFALSGSYTLVKTVRDAAFLSQLPVTVLPYVFIGVGVLTLVAAISFSRMTQRLATWESFAGGALVSALSLLGFAYLLRFHARWVPVAFYLWVNVYGLILMSQFWAFASSMSNPREARRTFGAVGVGGLLGGLCGGLVAVPLAQRWTLPALVTLAAVVLVSAVPLVHASLRHAIPVQPEPEAPQAGEECPLLCRTYVRWLIVAALCSVLVGALVDYQFKTEIQRRFPGRSELASFLGWFYSTVSVAALMLQLFVTRPLMQRLGAAGSVSLLPAGLAVATGFAIAVPGFAAATTARLWEQVMGLSISRVAGELFYFPLEPGLRRRVKSFIEAGVERLGEGVAGLIILVMAFVLATDTRTLAIVVAVMLAAWVVAWLGVRRGYIVELGRNVRRLNLGHQRVQISLREAGVIHEVARQLDSRFERVVLQSVEMLEENAPEVLAGRVPALLQHPASAVRVRALRWIRSRRPDAMLEPVSALMRDADKQVQGEALITYCALRRVGMFGALERLLGEGDAGLRSAAIACLAEHAGPAEEGRALPVLDEIVSRGPAEERVLVAEALGRRTVPGRAFDLLTRLLDDPDLTVRRAALRAAGVAQRREHVLRLLDALQHQATRDAARAGLAAFGERVVGTLGDYLADTGVSLELRVQIPRVLGEIRSQEAANGLFRARDRSDVRLSYQILKASNRIRASDVHVEFPRPLVTEDVEYDVRAHLWALVHYRACPIGERIGAERLLCIALNERMDQALNRIFRRLGLLYPPSEILAAYRGVTSESPKRWGNAIEYLENALSAEHRNLVLPLLESRSDEVRLGVAETRYGFRYVSYEDSLRALMQGDDPWLRTCALHVVGARKERSMIQQVESNLAVSDARVREAAQWAMLVLTGA